MAVTCPKCHSDNPATNQFCGDCGTQLSRSQEFPIEHSETPQTPSQKLISGSTFADRYQIIEKLGKGGMGEVYVAEDSKLNRKVAIKVLPSEMAVQPDRRKRFEREAKVIASLSHPNILSIHDFGEDQGVSFAVMELLEGENLRILLDTDPLSPSMAIDYAKQINPDLVVRYTPEDTVRSKFKNVIDASVAAIQAGADIISVADTTGFMVPGSEHNMYDYIKNLKESFDQKNLSPKIAVHCHNDRGLALANALDGIRAGAEIIDVSVLGLGERAGIVDMAQHIQVVSPNLDLRGAHHATCSGIESVW